MVYGSDLRYNMVMFIVGLFSWWYTTGWKQRITVAHERLLGVYDYFSIDLLARTLFSPFRQISAGKVQGPLGVQFRAWFDRLVSRCIGAVVRTIVMFVGIVAILLTCIIGLLDVLLWCIAPVLPLIGLLVSNTGWVPWHL